MQPGWYPDPKNPHFMLRWWDGTQWTVHEHPIQQSYTQQVAPGQQPQVEARTKKKSSKRVWAWVVAAGALGIALVAGLIVVPHLGGESVEASGDADSLKNVHELPVVHTDESLGLDYTEPVLDVGDLNASVEFKLEKDINAGDEQLGSLTSHKWAFRLYSDASLKSEITSSAIQLDDRVSVSVYESEEATWFGAGEEPQQTEIKTGSNDWGLYANYYLVRYVDVQGEELERPVVTRFNFANEVEAPSVTAGEAPERPGDLSITWAPVEDAERYIVVYGRSPGAETGDFEDPEMTLGLHYFHVGDTQDTTWRVSESLSAQRGGFDGERNLGIERSTIDADNGYGGEDYEPVDLSGDELGVVAVMPDGTRSPLGAVNAATTVSHLPARLATSTLELALEERRLEAAEGDIPAPLFFPYVGFTGQIQYSPVTLQDVSVESEKLRGVLTSQNGFEVPVSEAVQGITQDNLDEKVAAFNREAIDYAGNPGELHALGEAVIEFGTPQSEYEETGLPAPTAASHPMVDYLAQHLLAGTRTIDLTDWVNEPGAPDARAAIDEAITQTPLAFARFATANHDGTMVEVTYQFSSEDRQRQQQETLAAAEEAIASMNLEGKSDAQKVTAFNDYLAATVTYDYEALEALETYTRVDEYRYAFNAVGALDRGLAVCSGYSEVMNLFAQLEDIPSVYVSGKVHSGGLHAWNKFQIDGQWLAVDATWNDDGDVASHEYLLISDDDFTGNAERSEVADDWIIPTYAELYATP